MSKLHSAELSGLNQEDGTGDIERIMPHAHLGFRCGLGRLSFEMFDFVGHAAYSPASPTELDFCDFFGCLIETGANFRAEGEVRVCKV